MEEVLLSAVIASPPRELADGLEEMPLTPHHCKDNI